MNGKDLLRNMCSYGRNYNLLWGGGEIVNKLDMNVSDQQNWTDIESMKNIDIAQEKTFFFFFFLSNSKTQENKYRNVMYAVVCERLAWLYTRIFQTNIVR